MNCQFKTISNPPKDLTGPALNQFVLKCLTKDNAHDLKSTQLNRFDTSSYLKDWLLNAIQYQASECFDYLIEQQSKISFKETECVKLLKKCIKKDWHKKLEQLLTLPFNDRPQSPEKTLKLRDTKSTTLALNNKATLISFCIEHNAHNCLQELTQHFQHTEFNKNQLNNFIVRALVSKNKLTPSFLLLNFNDTQITYALMRTVKINNHPYQTKNTKTLLCHSLSKKITISSRNFSGILYQGFLFGNLETFSLLVIYLNKINLVNRFSLRCTLCDIVNYSADNEYSANKEYLEDKKQLVKEFITSKINNFKNDKYYQLLFSDKN